jgi:hypothetical protein
VYYKASVGVLDSSTTEHHGGRRWLGDQALLSTEPDLIVTVQRPVEGEEGQMLGRAFSALRESPGTASWEDSVLVEGLEWWQIRVGVSLLENISV